MQTYNCTFWRSLVAAWGCFVTSRRFFSLAVHQFWEPKKASWNKFSLQPNAINVANTLSKKIFTQLLSPLSDQSSNQQSIALWLWFWWEIRLKNPSCGAGCPLVTESPQGVTITSSLSSLLKTNIPWHWANFDCRLYYCNITDKKKYFLEMHSIFSLFQLDITLFQS